jgi:hypothetical protein
MKKISIFIGFLLLLNVNQLANAIPYAGIDFPAGPISFIDEVLSYEPDFYGEPPIPLPTDSTVVIGPPRGPGDNWSLPIGNGGRITLGFIDNFLIGSGDNQPDLWIFELGTGVEHTFVEISKDGLVWHFVGKALGSTSGIDIDLFGYGPNDAFSFVRLMDDPNQLPGGQPAGADIDAVGASSTIPVPIPATMLLLSTSLVGLAGMGRKKFFKK